MSLAVGRRIRALRTEENLTIQELAEASAIGSKGHLSNIERGLVRPNIQTLKQLAQGLGVQPLDLLTFPEREPRHKVIELTRKLSAKQLTELVRWILRRVLSKRR